MYFEVGTIYENLLTGRVIKVESYEYSDEGTNLEFWELNRLSMQPLFFNCLYIKEVEYLHWEKVDLVENVENK